MIKLDNRGFTLVEVLSVVVIISLILVITVPSVSSLMDKGEGKELEARYKLIVSEVDLYVSTHKKTTEDIRTTSCGYTTEYLSNNREFTNKDILYNRDQELIKGCVVYNRDSGEFVFKETCEPCS